jgi:uncharacterized protein with von Willebrand factor type A (vWA) domain
MFRRGSQEARLRYSNRLARIDTRAIARRHVAVFGTR